MKIRSIPTWIRALIFFAVVTVVMYFVFSRGLLTEYWQQILLAGTILAISALGLNLKYGYAGLFAIGHAAFYGIGAYSSAWLPRIGRPNGAEALWVAWPAWWALKLDSSPQWL